jgi:hypothetical protein
MYPNSIAVKIAAAVVLLLVGIGIGFQVQGWRKDAEISQLGSKQSNAALEDLKTASKAIKDQAAGFQLDTADLKTQMGALRKEFKNVRPLPAGCKPDADRLRNLQQAVSTTNKAIAGQPAGKSVPAYP